MAGRRGAGERQGKGGGGGSQASAFAPQACDDRRSRASQPARRGATSSPYHQPPAAASQYALPDGGGCGHDWEGRARPARTGGSLANAPASNERGHRWPRPVALPQPQRAGADSLARKAGAAVRPKRGGGGGGGAGAIRLRDLGIWAASPRHPPSSSLTWCEREREESAVPVAKGKGWWQSNGGRAGGDWKRKIIGVSRCVERWREKLARHQVARPPPLGTLPPFATCGPRGRGRGDRPWTAPSPPRPGVASTRAPQTGTFYF